MTTYQQAVVADGPVLYYPMQEGVIPTHPTDLMGVYTTSTFAGAGWSVGTGPLINLVANSCYVNSGAAGTKLTVSGGTIPILAGKVATWSIEFWEKINTLTAQGSFTERDPAGGNNALLAASTIGGNGQIGPLFRDDPGTLTYTLANGGIVSGSIAACNINDNLWHYIVIIKDPNSVFTVYKDGVSVCSMNWTAGSTNTMNDPSINTVIGQDPVSGVSWAGSLAHMAIYTKALTAAQVAAHWANAQAGITASAPRGIRYHVATR